MRSGVMVRIWFTVSKSDSIPFNCCWGKPVLKLESWFGYCEKCFFGIAAFVNASLDFIGHEIYQQHSLDSSHRKFSFQFCWWFPFELRYSILLRILCF
jgi:hypothetical protein